jgi:hypothetical protein
MLEDPQSLLEVRVHKLSEENARLKRELQALQAIQVVASQVVAAGDLGSAAAATDGAADAPTASPAASTLTRQLTDKELQDLNGQAPPLSPGTVAAASATSEAEAVKAKAKAQHEKEVAAAAAAAAAMAMAQADFVEEGEEEVFETIGRSIGDHDVDHDV